MIKTLLYTCFFLTVISCDMNATLNTWLSGQTTGDGNSNARYYFPEVKTGDSVYGELKGGTSSGDTAMRLYFNMDPGGNVGDVASVNNPYTSTGTSCPIRDQGKFYAYVRNKFGSSSLKNNWQFRINKLQTHFKANQTNLFYGFGCDTVGSIYFKSGPFFSYQVTNAALGPLRIFIYPINSKPVGISIRQRSDYICDDVLSSSIISTKQPTSTDYFFQINENEVTNGFYYIQTFYPKTNNCDKEDQFSVFYIGICQGTNCQMQAPPTSPPNTNTIEPTNTMNTSPSPSFDTNTNTTNPKQTNDSNDSNHLLVDYNSKSIIVILFFLLQCLMMID